MTQTKKQNCFALFTVRAKYKVSYTRPDTQTFGFSPVRQT